LRGLSTLIKITWKVLTGMHSHAQRRKAKIRKAAIRNCKYKKAPLKGLFKKISQS